MTKIKIFSAIFLFIFFFLSKIDPNPSRDGNPETPGNHVGMDFDMVEKGIGWLEFIQSGAEEKAIKKYFMNFVAPTGGCQAIIHHWERFREWDTEIFYRFILTAMDRLPTDKKVKNSDGTLTMFGRLRRLWQEALKDTGKLRTRLVQLKEIDIKKQSITLAKRHLPADAMLQADFYFVLFGYSNAFSVGKENGYDFLQLPLKADDKIDAQHLILTIAHELHHCGFSSLQGQRLKGVKNRENILLAGILSSEGMATYFIDQPWKNLDDFQSNREGLSQLVAADWKKHSARLDDLYRESEQDIRRNLEGKMSQKEIMERWMSGVKGAAYVLGNDLIGTIDRYLGHDTAVDIAGDYRQLLFFYNKAAHIANRKGKNKYTFDPRLANALLHYTGK